MVHYNGDTVPCVLEEVVEVIDTRKGGKRQVVTCMGQKPKYPLQHNVKTDQRAA